MKTLSIIRTPDWDNQVVEWEVEVKVMLVQDENVKEVLSLTNLQIDLIFDTNYN